MVLKTRAGTEGRYRKSAASLEPPLPLQSSRDGWVKMVVGVAPSCLSMDAKAKDSINVYCWLKSSFE